MGSSQSGWYQIEQDKQTIKAQAKEIAEQKEAIEGWKNVCEDHQQTYNYQLSAASDEASATITDLTRTIEILAAEMVRCRLYMTTDHVKLFAQQKMEELYDE